MGFVQQNLSDTFNRFFASEKSSGILLILCTVASLLSANSSIGATYLSVWQGYVGGLSLEHWINDGLMAIFFLPSAWNLNANCIVVNWHKLRTHFFRFLRPSAEWSYLRSTHFSLNAGTSTRAGVRHSDGYGHRVCSWSPGHSRKSYSCDAESVWGPLPTQRSGRDRRDRCVLHDAPFGLVSSWCCRSLDPVCTVSNRLFRVMTLVPYSLGGALLWFLMLQSGVHATIAA